MASVRFKLDGDLGEITVKAFLGAAKSWLDVMADIDVAISHRSTGSLDWVVTNLTTGSLCMEMESRSRVIDMNVGAEVAREAVHGLQLLEQEGRTPPYLSEQGLRYMTKVVKTIGNHGVTGIRVDYRDNAAQASARASANIDQLLPPRYSSLGSVEGRLDVISLHATHRFVVYDSATHKAITCTFASDWLDRVKDALGHRVNVEGTVHWNAKGEPVRVESADLRIFRDESELPTIKEMAGRYPDITGGTTAEEHIRKLRYGS